MTKCIGRLLVWSALLAAAPGQDDPAALAARAMQLARQGKFAELVPVVDRWIAAAPTAAPAFAMRAWIRCRTQEFDGAIADATRAIELDPNGSRGYGERGFARFAKGDLEGALADYDRAIELEPSAAHLHGERGDLLSAAKQYAKAIGAYDRAIALRPGWAEAFTGRGEAACNLADHPAALRDFVRALELSPDDLALWRLRADAEFDCRDDAAALRSAAELAKRVPEEHRGRAFALRGRLAWQTGDLVLAANLLDDAAKQQQAAAARADALLSLGCVHLAAGNDAAARAALARAQECDAPELSFWIALMIWCVDARERGVEAAATDLVARLEGKAGLDELQRSLVALCRSGEGGDLAALRGVGPPEACARAFFAAWRALCSRDDERADRLLLHCVNTGRKDWTQWATAVSLLRSRPFGKALQPALGADLEFAARNGTTVGVVRSVASGSAAECQGLAAGDEIVELAGRAITAERWRELDSRAREGLDVFVSRRRAGVDTPLMLRFGLVAR